MRPSRLRSERAIVQHGQPRFGMIGRHDFGLRLAIDFAQIIPPRAGRRIGPSFDAGPIELLDLAMLELPGQLLGGAAARGKDHRPGGRPIEPVRHAEIDVVRRIVALLQETP